MDPYLFSNGIEFRGIPILVDIDNGQAHFAGGVVTGGCSGRSLNGERMQGSRFKVELTLQSHHTSVLVKREVVLSFIGVEEESVGDGEKWGLMGVKWGLKCGGVTRQA